VAEETEKEFTEGERGEKDRHLKRKSSSEVPNSPSHSIKSTLEIIDEGDVSNSSNTKL